MGLFDVSKLTPNRRDVYGFNRETPIILASLKYKQKQMIYYPHASFYQICSAISS